MCQEESQPWVLGIEKIPRGYIVLTESPRHEQADGHGSAGRRAKFERFLGALMFANLSVHFRFEANGGNIRLLYGGMRSQPSVSAIESAFLAQFPDFQIAHVFDSLPPLELPCEIVVVKGVPKPADQPLNGLAHIMAQYPGTALYQVSARPRRPEYLVRYLSKKRYKSALERSQRQRGSSGLLRSQESGSKVDVDSMRLSSAHEATYQRMQSGRVLACQVALAFWGSENAGTALDRAVGVLLSTISSADSKQQMRVNRFKGTKALEILRRLLVGKGQLPATLLTPAEAVSLFEIPSIELGLASSSPASFTTAGSQSVGRGSQDVAFQPGKVVLGQPYRLDSPDPRYLKTIELESLRYHVTIVGKTGTGKSTSKNRLIIDAWKNGVPSLIIEPVKTDARILLGVIPEMRLFTVGQESIAPWRDNPFMPEPGVPVQSHISFLYSCFVAAWPLYGMLANHVRRMLEETYIHNGWDPVNEVRGNVITLDSFREEVDRYCEEVLQYGSELFSGFPWRANREGRRPMQSGTSCDIQHGKQPAHVRNHIEAYNHRTRTPH